MDSKGYSATRYGLMSMPRMLLVRHGESEWNAQGRWQGQADPPLSDRGRHDALLAAKSIGAVDVVMSSTLERARDTAELISSQLGIGPVLTDRRLIERDAGEWSGLTRDEINADWPGYLVEGGLGERPPGWEADESLLERALAALQDLAVAVDDDSDILVVTHGGVIYAIEAFLGAERQYLPNLGARWLTITDRLLALGPRAVLLENMDTERRTQIVDSGII